MPFCDMAYTIAHTHMQASIVPLLECSFSALFRDEIRTVTDFRTKATSFILALHTRGRGGGRGEGEGGRGEEGGRQDNITERMRHKKRR